MKKITTVPVISVIAIALIGVGLYAHQYWPHAGKLSTPASVYRMDADHETYDSVDSLASASDTVIIGTVEGQTNRANNSKPKDAAGNPINLPPHTDYTIQVDQILKGTGLQSNKTIAVSLTGGTASTGTYVLDGGPTLTEGDQYVFFLRRGNDKRYYPLAGGAAIATKNAGSSFTLASEVTGQTNIAFATDSLKPELSISIERARIDMAKNPGRSRAHIVGSYSLPQGTNFTCADAITIGLNPPTVNATLQSKMLRRDGTYCRYVAPSSDNSPVETLTLDLKHQTFDLTIRKEANLNRITNPVTFVLQLGQLKGLQTIHFEKHGKLWYYRTNIGWD